MTITAFVDAVSTLLGREILRGSKHVSSNVAWPRLVCVPLDGEVNDPLEAGGRLDSGVDYEHLIGLRQIMCEWHIWEEDFETAEATANAVYIAIHRTAVAQDSQTSIVGEQWINEQEGAVTSGGSYVILRASIGIRLIDTGQTPLLTPTAVAGTGFFNGEQICPRLEPVAYSPLTLSCDMNNDTQDEKIDFTDFAEVDFGKTSKFAAGAWYKWSGAGGYDLLGKYNHTGSVGWLMFMMGGLDAGNVRVAFADEGAGSFYARWKANPHDGLWHLIGFSYDGSNDPNGIQIYVDGGTAGHAISGSGLPGTLENSAPLIVGGRLNWPAGEFIGKVCHSFVAARELTADDWLEIYNAGVPQTLDRMDWSPSIVHWSTLGDGCAIGADNMISLVGPNGEFLNGESGDFVADVPP